MRGEEGEGGVALAWGNASWYEGLGGEGGDLLWEVGMLAGGWCGWVWCAIFCF